MAIRGTRLSEFFGAKAQRVFPITAFIDISIFNSLLSLD
jgi:hypothetical protein